MAVFQDVGNPLENGNTPEVGGRAPCGRIMTRYKGFNGPHTSSGLDLVYGPTLMLKLVLKA